jgi:hypothetical protein
MTLLKACTASSAIGAVVVALIIWRADLVRLLPQSAAFDKLAGSRCPCAGLRFNTTETVEGKPGLIAEGAMVGVTRKPVDLPRLRFSVRVAQGPENRCLELLPKPGEARRVQVALCHIRFFDKRDIAGASA